MLNSVATQPAVKYLFTDLPNDVPYMATEDDVMATSEDLPNGLHPVVLDETIGRGAGGKYTHSAISVIFLSTAKSLRETTFNIIAQKGGIGCLHIINNKIQSLSLKQETIDKLNCMGIKEIMISSGEKDFLKIDHHTPFRPAKSDEQYEAFCSKMLLSGKKIGIIV